MQCPKCKSNMEHIHTPYGDVERCVSCVGIWVDMLEQIDLKKIADEVDIGDAKEGKKFNKIDQIYCPVCPNNKLLRMVDPIQSHIWFESCPTCYGRFYDAGELKDLSERTIGDFIKSFLITERK